MHLINRRTINKFLVIYADVAARLGCYLRWVWLVRDGLEWFGLGWALFGSDLGLRFYGHPDRAAEQCRR